MKLTLSQMHEKRMKLKYVKWEKRAYTSDYISTSTHRHTHANTFSVCMWARGSVCVNHHGSSYQHIAIEHREKKQWICEKFTGVKEERIMYETTEE